jgi:hypothetical protein
MDGYMIKICQLCASPYAKSSKMAHSQFMKSQYCGVICRNKMNAQHNPRMTDEKSWKLFWANIVQNGDCLEWSGKSRNQGYGAFGYMYKTIPAHRYSYKMTYGNIPIGYQIDHLSRNTLCVNPAHLEAVTPRENTLRSTSLIAVNAAKTHCQRGHEFTPENIIPRVKNGIPARNCRRCYIIKHPTGVKYAQVY